MPILKWLFGLIYGPLIDHHITDELIAERKHWLRRASELMDS